VIPALPVADWIENLMDFLTENFANLFTFLQKAGQNSMDAFTNLLMLIPPIIFILLVAVIAFFATKKKFGLAAFVIIGLIFIYNQQLWEQLMSTVTLVVFASIIAIIIGIPIGILMSKSTIAENIIKPILDFMQTMPGFV